MNSYFVSHSIDWAIVIINILFSIFVFLLCICFYAKRKNIGFVFIAAVLALNIYGHSKTVMKDLMYEREISMTATHTFYTSFNVSDYLLLFGVLFLGKKSKTLS